MPSSVPLSPVSDDGTGAYGMGAWWASTDHSVSGSPISTNHNLMTDDALTGGHTLDVSGGSTHLSVGGLVLLALLGMVAIHLGGFRAMVNASVGR